MGLSEYEQSLVVFLMVVLCLFFAVFILRLNVILEVMFAVFLLICFLTGVRRGSVKIFSPVLLTVGVVMVSSVSPFLA